MNVVESSAGANRGPCKSISSFCGNVKPSEAWLNFVLDGEDYTFTSSDGTEYVAVAPLYGTLGGTIKDHERVWAVTTEEFNKNGYFLWAYGEGAVKIVDVPKSVEQAQSKTGDLTRADVLRFLKNDPSKFCWCG